MFTKIVVVILLVAYTVIAVGFGCLVERNKHIPKFSEGQISAVRITVTIMFLVISAIVLMSE